MRDVTGRERYLSQHHRAIVRPQWRPRAIAPVKDRRIDYPHELVNSKGRDHDIGPWRLVNGALAREDSGNVTLPDCTDKITHTRINVCLAPIGAKPNLLMVSHPRSSSKEQVYIENRGNANGDQQGSKNPKRSRAESQNSTNHGWVSLAWGAVAEWSSVQ
jgi:hypothetical protein